MSMSPGDARTYLCKLLKLLISGDDWPHYDFSPLLHWLKEEDRKAHEGDDNLYDALHRAIDCCEHEERRAQEQGRLLERAMTCPFIHENVDTLYGVPVMPVENLPRVCTCGAKITYAATVAFINGGAPDDSADGVFESPWLRISPVKLHYKETKKL